MGEREKENYNNNVLQKVTHNLFSDDYYDDEDGFDDENGISDNKLNAMIYSSSSANGKIYLFLDSTMKALYKPPF